MAVESSVLKVLRAVGQRGVGADGNALHALGAVFGDVERGLAAGDVLGSGVAGACGNDAQGAKRSGGLIVAQAGAELGVECVDAGDGRARRLAGGHFVRAAAAVGAGGAHFDGDCFENGKQRFAAKRRVVSGGERADGDLADALPALLHDFHVGLDNGFALLAELFHVLLVDNFKVLLTRDAEFIEQAGDGEECAEEGVALHAELEVGAIGGLAGDVKAGERVDADVFFDDLLARPDGEILPGALAFLVGLPNERAAGLHAVERVGVGEGLGVATEDGGHMAEVAVDPDALLGGDHEVAGGRALFLRTVLGVGGDVDDFLGIAVLVHDLVAFVEEVVEVADDSAEIFAGSDGAPAANGVEADGDCAFR